MDIRKQQTVEELRKAREQLLSIKKSNLSYNLIVSWGQQWEMTFRKADSYGQPIKSQFNHMIYGYEKDTDVEVLHALRLAVIELLDRTTLAIDSQVVIRSVLQELISKVQDQKLATLLLEFNYIKDTSPNHAAIGFRTILILIINERAKLVNPNSALAQQVDLAVDPDIAAALRDHIFSHAEERHLERFKNGGRKVIFDNITHKPGATYLVNKADLEDAVDLLNSLLPTIIP